MKTLVLWVCVGFLISPVSGPAAERKPEMCETFFSAQPVQTIRRLTLAASVWGAFITPSFASEPKVAELVFQIGSLLAQPSSCVTVENYASYYEWKSIWVVCNGTRAMEVLAFRDDDPEPVRRMSRGLALSKVLTRMGEFGYQPLVSPEALSSPQSLVFQKH